MDKIVKNLGGDRLGSGSKMDVQMHKYERSTHDLSRAWRSTMAPGTLIPFFQEIALNGDTWDIDLQAMVRTLPTVGPLFGSYKLQLDIFQCPLRLYNGILHNNATKIGMEMDKVIFPKIILKSGYIENTESNDPRNSIKTASSCLLNYLGIKGVGMPSSDAVYKTNSMEESRTTISRTFFAGGLLSYWDIFKNYYANKQEDNAFVIGQKTEYAKVHSVSIIDGEKITDTTSTTTPYGRRISGASSITKPVYINTGETSIQQIVNISAEELQSGTSHGPFYTIKVGQSLMIYHDPIENLTDMVYSSKAGSKGSVTSFDDIEERYPFFKVTTIHPRGSESKKFSTTKITYLREPTEQEMQDLNQAEPWSMYRVGILESYRTEKKSIDLIPFPLENIDEMREQILATSGKNAIVYITDATSSSFSAANLAYKTSKRLGFLPYQQVCLNSKDGSDNVITNANQTPLNGVAIKTYQSDIYNNWLNSEWIDGKGIDGKGNSIQQITAISTTDGSFTIDELILAKKVYDMLNRIAIAGGTYEDWQEAVYGEEAMKRAESPIYCGGMSQEIEFEEIVSSSQTSVNNEEKALGTLAGKGTLNPHTRKGGNITIKVKEPSLIMGIVSITPRIDYSQGNDWLVNLETMNDLHKPALDGIGFQDLIAEQMAWWTTIVKINASDTATPKPSQIQQQAIGKQPAWINYQTAVSQVYGEFAEDSKRYMTLQRQYEESGINIKDATTYIDPSKYNYAFANQELTSQNFWVNIGIKAIARRKMSAKLMPNL